MRKVEITGDGLSQDTASALDEGNGFEGRERLGVAEDETISFLG